jgi:hypothetical protein
MPRAFRYGRHREERSDEAIQGRRIFLDCFASPQ